MRVKYLNLNGELLVENESLLTVENRSFRYGDGIFETMLWKNGGIRFLDKHVQRLQDGMKILHLEDHHRFSHGFIYEKAYQLIEKNGYGHDNFRIRLQVYRNGEGLYSPVTNQPSYVMSVSPLQAESQMPKPGLIVGLYTDQFKPFSGLSHLKSNNSLVYVLAGNYRKKQGLDEVIILNQDGMVCEGVQNNVFVVYQGKLYTPALNQGCVAGIMRATIMDIAKELGIEVVEAIIDPRILDEADEMFMTNAIRGLQWVVGYNKKRYFHQVSKKILSQLEKLDI